MSTRLTINQVKAMEDISGGLSGAQFDAIHPLTRRALFRRGYIKKDWLHPHAYGDVEYLKLTQEGKEALGWETCNQF